MSADPVHPIRLQTQERHHPSTPRPAHTTVAFTILGDDGKAERTVWLGAAHEGRVLEVITINIDNRPKYRDH